MKEKINNVLFDSSVRNLIKNLYFRWLDEKEYEDINEYAACLIKAIKKLERDATLIKPTKRPFGVQVKMYGILIHFFVRQRDGYLQTGYRIL